MNKLESSLKNMLLSLTLITAFAGALLGGVYALTKAPIADAQQLKQDRAKAEVLSQEGNYTFTTVEGGRNVVVYKAFDESGDLAGYSVQTSDSNAFNGLISLMVGFDTTGVITGYTVLSQSETPGLGANMVDWFKTNKGKQCIVGLNPSEKKFFVSKDGGDVDAITAATITSRAFLRAVKLASDELGAVRLFDELDKVAVQQEADSTFSPSKINITEEQIHNLFDQQ